MAMKGREKHRAGDPQPKVEGELPGEPIPDCGSAGASPSNGTVADAEDPLRELLGPPCPL